MYDPDRAAALTAAVAMHTAAGTLRLRCGVDADDTIALGELLVRGTAETFLAWLRGPTRLVLTAGPVVDQATGAPVRTQPQGDPMQIHDTEQFDLSVHELDKRGFETSDPAPLSWTVADDTIATLAVSDDTRTCTVKAAAPGSTVVTVAVTLADGTVLTATEAVDVAPGAVATISIAEGPVTAQA